MQEATSNRVEVTSKPQAPAKRRRGALPRARPLDLANYLRARADELADAWTADIAARELGQDAQFDRVVGRFMAQLTSLLPWFLGPHGSQVQPLWDRTAELFGVMAAKRGLAAGEVIEEFQLLRPILIRTVFRDPPPEGPLSLRDLLRLNRIVDRGVTHASVGHTDAMFFHYLESEGTTPLVSPGEIAREAEAQLAVVEEELAQIVEVTPAESTAGELRN